MRQRIWRETLPPTLVVGVNCRYQVMDFPREKILLLGTNLELTERLRGFLQPTYQVETANSPQMAEFLFQEWEPKICLFEDHEDHVTWVSRLRSLRTGSRLGIICYSSGPNTHEEKALKNGCDHWVQVDEDFEKLSWRIQSLLRSLHSQLTSVALKAVPSGPDTEPALEVDQVKIYPKDFLVKRQGTVVSISPTQFKLLNVFVSHPDQLLSREWIKAHVWSDSEISLRSIDAHISKLRKALPELDRYLLNIYGKGYVFSRSKQEAA